MKKTQGHVQPKQQGGSMKSQLHGAEVLLLWWKNIQMQPSQNTAVMGRNARSMG